MPPGSSFSWVLLLLWLVVDLYIIFGLLFEAQVGWGEMFCQQTGDLVCGCHDTIIALGCYQHCTEVTPRHKGDSVDSCQLIVFATITSL